MKIPQLPIYSAAYPMKLISYVLPVYNEEEGIREFFAELVAQTQTLSKKYQFEFVFVNDGSQDNSWEVLQELRADDDRITLINFSRNFGHQRAVTAGLDHATGDAVIVMDTDLQDPPRVSLELISKWEEGFEVVYATRAKRQDRFLKKITADWYYRVLDGLSDISIPRNTGDFRLIDRKVVDQIKQFREQNRYIRGLVSFVGFKQTPVYFDRDARFAGRTGYSISKMLKLAFDGITSFSTKPLQLITQIGTLATLLGFFTCIYLLLSKLIWPQAAITDWAIIVGVVLFMGGVQLLSLGILGVYIGRIYREVQNRPLYIVDQVHGQNSQSD